jgi:hypothetical protein
VMFSTFRKEVLVRRRMKRCPVAHLSIALRLSPLFIEAAQ